MIFVTGGCGFIGSNFILDWFAGSDEPVVNIDVLTYAGNPGNLAKLGPRVGKDYFFAQVDIGDSSAVTNLLHRYQPRAIINFAAESHVDRSILGPEAFVRTNVAGTAALLRAATAYWEGLGASQRTAFRFLQISTDEVYGSLGPQDPPFNERTPYAPNSPYSASKAASDHFVRAFHHTYGLPVLTTHCSNNFGSFQFPEKLIPLMVCNALADRSLPIYGDGGNIRDWIYVGDHCAALRAVLQKGVPGETYAIGGGNERNNLDVVKGICSLLNKLQSRSTKAPYEDLITFVTDRPGHDRRYAVDSTKIRRETGWRPIEDFESGLLKTVQWYLDNQDWVTSVTSGAYRDWIAQQYSQRVMQ